MAVLVGVAGSLVLATGASAATLEVDTTTDEITVGGTGCSLREALLTANGNPAFTECGTAATSDVVVFDPAVFAPGGAVETINLAGIGTDLNVTEDLQIVGPGMGELVVTNSNGPSANGRIFLVSGATTVTFSGFDITGGSMSGTTTVAGGGIFNAGNLTLHEIRLANNTVSAANSVGNAPAVIATGGGVSSTSAGQLTISDSVITGNQAAATSNSAVDASPRAMGGGVYTEGSLTIDRTTVATNSANLADPAGGAVGASSGGGIHTAEALNLRRSTVTANSTANSAAAGGAQGGGVHTADPVMPLDEKTVELSTITANTADSPVAGQDQGGGIYASSELTVVSSTLAANGPLTGTEPGSNFFRAGGQVVFNNTIVADPRGGGANCNTGLVSGDFNIDEDSSCNLGGGSDLNGDPMLGPLQDNGGPTETMEPLPGSPVLDQGSDNQQNVTTDQRGFARVADFPAFSDADNGEDIGAVEVAIGPPTFVSTSPASPNSDDTPTIRGTGVDGLVRLYTDPNCTVQTGPTTSTAAFSTTGTTVSPVARNATTTFYGAITTAHGTSRCSAGAFPNTIAYTHADPPASGPTGRRAAALKKCKKKRKKKARKKCRKKAKRLPV